jgi:hypothetical protein
MLTLSYGHVFAASFTIKPDQLGDLRDQRALLGAKVKELDEIGKRIDAAQSDKNFAMESIRRQETESVQARLKLEKLQDFDRENPGEISPEQLRSAEERNKLAFRTLKEAKEKRTGAEAKVNMLNVEADSQYAEFLRLQKSFERDVDRVVDTQLQERIHSLQVSKEVEVTERVACGDDSIPVCKERAKKAAELKATERGSVVFVNSLTEVKNFKLSREELRSEVQATLSDKVFSNQHMVGETEYETTIKASVVPAISDSLREQMSGSIRSEVYAIVGGKIDFAQVKNPAAKSAMSASSDEEEEEEPAPVQPVPVKRKKIAQKPVPQQEVEQQEVEQPVRQWQPPPQPAPRQVERPTFSF